MANPRMTTSLEGIDPVLATFEGDGSTITYDATTRGTNLRNRAVSLSASRTAQLTADGDAVLGAIDHVEADGRVVVQIGGMTKFAQGDTTVVIGTKIVGMTLSAVRGYVRSVPATAGTYAQGTATDTARGRGLVCDIADTTAIQVWL